MARVEVRQLRYRGEPAHAGRVEHVVADAVRTEVVDDGRLLLVRSFRLGRIGLGQRGASREAAAVWRRIRENARHGGASGAEGANCVWFADAAEARMLLMRELARGRTPFAWFWMLAVPDWRREPLAQWLGRRLDETARDASGETLAALVAEAGAADCAEPLAAAILARIPPPRFEPLPVPVGGGRPRQERENAQSPPGWVTAAEDAAAEAVSLAIVRSIPATVRAVVVTVATRVELAAFVDRLARGLVRRAHPALTLAPARVAAIAAVVVRILRFGEHSAGAVPRSVHAMPAPAPPRADQAPGDGPPPTGDRRPAAAVDIPAVDGALSQAVPPPRDTPHALAEPCPAELRSAAAGVFLAIMPLVRLGWREWLAARPHLLLHQPGPRLLRRIAAHYRVPESDPLWDQLPPVDPRDAPPPDLEQALLFWCAGLDGWLRRKARLRLADLVLRPGWLVPGVETTLIRFPLQAIEIRLRRLALDGDPGWVDWLGHSYRVLYRDRPLLGTDLA